MLSIQAFIAVHNAEATVGAVLDHFTQNKIDIVVIDHGSTDGSPEIIRRHMGATVSDVIREPFNGVFELQRQLEIKNELIRRSTASWVIHCDADEILESPVEGESLRAMIERCDVQDVGVINCGEFIFCPVNEDEDFVGTDFIRKMRRYYYFAPVGLNFHRVTRRAGYQGEWSESGGHQLSVPEHRVASERIRKRHYLALSLDQLRAKYLGRVFPANELKRGWHCNRVPTVQDFIVAPDPARLFHLDHDGWRTDRPEQKHLLFHQPEQYRPPAALKPSRDHAPMPFIVGVARSGTTLLRFLLDAHPDLAIPPETHWLGGALLGLEQSPTDMRSVFKRIATDPTWGDMHFTAREIESIVEDHDARFPAESLRSIYRRYASRFGARRIGDKTPLHGLMMHRIASVLPEARFIHIIRDGRDVATSHRGLWFGPGNDMRAAAIFWIWRIREMRQQAQFLPHYLEVRYEDLVTDAESVLRKIADFIDLPFHPAQMTAHLAASKRLEELSTIVRGNRLITGEQRRGIHRLTTSPPDPSRAGRWKTAVAPEEIRAFERVAGDMLRDLGYD